MKLHPLWMLFLIPNMLFAIAGSSILDNEFLPPAITAINFIFILTLFDFKKLRDNLKNLNKMDKNAM